MLWKSSVRKYLPVHSRSSFGDAKLQFLYRWDGEDLKEMENIFRDLCCWCKNPWNKRSCILFQYQTMYIIQTIRKVTGTVHTYLIENFHQTHGVQPKSMEFDWTIYKYLNRIQNGYTVNKPWTSIHQKHESISQYLGNRKKHRKMNIDGKWKLGNNYRGFLHCAWLVGWKHVSLQALGFAFLWSGSSKPCVINWLKRILVLPRLLHQRLKSACYQITSQINDWNSIECKKSCAITVVVRRWL